ncbi:MAG: DUF4355 domain-containing protein [Caldilineaceae bacterium]|nr:DUF4355 domain-containing protein [Caldilineaceae bacterium]
MADEQQQAADQEVEQPTEQPEAQQVPDDATGDENGGNEARFSQADVDRIVKERLDRAKSQAEKAAAKAAEDAQRKAAEEQGEYKKLYQSLQTKVEEAERRAAELERRELLREAAEKSGLPAALADRLRGESLDELMEDAKTLLASMPKSEKTAPATNINGTARGTTRQAPSDDDIREQAAVLGVSFELLKQQYGGD